jgi:phosphoesterase RecJ-like protein
MATTWQPLRDLILQHQRFLLTTHVRPDGDGLGSLRALACALRHLGKQVHLVYPTSLFPARYDFLDPQKEVTPFARSSPQQREAEVIVIADTGTWGQLGDMAPFLRSTSAVKVVLDHHLTQDDLGAWTFVDASAEATGRLAWEVVQALGVPVTADIADAVFTALAMDTGWFRHTNTSARTFGLAADLVAAGANPTRLYELLFERCSLGRLKLTAVVLQRLSCEGSIAWSYVAKDDYPRVGAVPPDSEDLVNWTLTLQGTQVGILFLEQPGGGIKVSFRSRSRVDVSRLAAEFGGGGHAAAAGAIVPGELDEVQRHVLARAEAHLQQTTPSGLSSALGVEK